MSSSTEASQTTLKETRLRISELHPFYDPSAYPLFHIHGDYGYELNCYKREDNKKLTTLDFYRSRMMVREGEFNTLHRGERLFQEYLTDQYCKIEKDPAPGTRYIQGLS